MIGLDIVSIGDRIRKKRKELGMTQLELAKKVCLSAGSVSKYENGKVEEATSAKFHEFAQALGVTPAYLMGWSKQWEVARDGEDYSGVRKKTGVYENQISSETYRKIQVYLDYLPEDGLTEAENYLAYLWEKYRKK